MKIFLTISTKIKLRLVRLWLGATVGFAAAVLTYLGVFFTTIPHDDIPSSYKWFLLQSVPSPRLIVEGGSGANTSMNAELIGAAFGMNGINIADSAAYRLLDKMTRLDRYAQPGDVVLLLLEWPFYYTSPSTLNESYVLHSFIYLPEYFWQLSWRERLERILHVPLRVAWNIMAINLPSVTYLKQGIQQRLFSLVFQANLHADGSSAQKVSRGLDPTVRGGCAASLVALPLHDGQLPAAFDPIILRLKALQARGIDVILAPPTVTGADCYNNRGNLDAFESNLARRLAAEGLLFVGRRVDFWMPPEYTDDTHYHVTTAGRAIVTQRMIVALKAAGLKARDGHDRITDMSEWADKSIYELERKLSQTNKWPKRQLPANPAVGFEAVAFDAGWWGQEPTGRWMRRNQAMFRILCPQEPFQLVIAGYSFETPRRMKVTVNGVAVGLGQVGTTDISEIVVPVSANALKAGHGCEVILDLDPHPPASPLSLGQSPDFRNLTMFVTGVSALRTPPRDCGAFPRP